MIALFAARAIDGLGKVWRSVTWSSRARAVGSVGDAPARTSVNKVLPSPVIRSILVTSKSTIPCTYDTYHVPRYLTVEYDKKYYTWILRAFPSAVIILLLLSIFSYFRRRPPPVSRCVCSRYLHSIIIMRAISIIFAAAMLASSVSASNDPRECEGEGGRSYPIPTTFRHPLLTKNAVPCPILSRADAQLLNTSTIFSPSMQFA